MSVPYWANSLSQFVPHVGHRYSGLFCTGPPSPYQLQGISLISKPKVFSVNNFRSGAVYASKVGHNGSQTLTAQALLLNSKRQFLIQHRCYSPICIAVFSLCICLLPSLPVCFQQGAMSFLNVISFRFLTNITFVPVIDHFIFVDQEL